jgi:hypothetical protein
MQVEQLRMCIGKDLMNGWQASSSAWPGDAAPGRKSLASKGGDRRRVLPVLLELTSSTAVVAVGTLGAIGLLPWQAGSQPNTAVTVMTSVKIPAADARMDIQGSAILNCRYDS